jgi:hypothetical protein
MNKKPVFAWLWDVFSEDYYNIEKSQGGIVGT